MNLTEKQLMQIVGVFKHKDNYYMMLLNERCNRYYLRIDNNTLCNITLDEYIDINKTYFSPRIIKSNKKIKIEPLIRFKNKLITLSMAASIMVSLAACGKTEASVVTPDVQPRVETEIEYTQEEPELVEEEQVEDIKIVETELDKTIKELEEIGVSVQNVYPDVDLYKINGVDLNQYVYQGIDFSPLEEAKYTNQCTPGEFHQYINKQNITYDDVREVLSNNSNVNYGIKKTLLDGIDNMEAKGFNMDLSVLYYNLSRLQVEYVEPGWLGNNIGVYDHISGKVFLDLSIQEETPGYIQEVIIHEVLGHGSTRAYNEEQKVMCDVMDPYLEITEQGEILNAGFLGHFGVEGIADLITSIANNKKLESQTAAYTTEVYELSTLCASNGLSIEEYANGGIQVLIEKMKENGVDNPYQTISVFDSTTEMMMANVLVQSDLTDVFIEYYDELEENNIDNLNESSLAYKDYIQTVNLDENEELIVKLNDDDTLAWLNPDAITSSIENDNVLAR